METRNRLVVANWKMNGSASWNATWVQAFLSAGGPHCEVVVCPPFVYLPQLAQLLAGSGIGLGAQTVSDQTAGAFTGEVCAKMLPDVGCQWVIVGHSERRHLYGETNEIVAAKAERALAAGLKTIVAVGETLAEREAQRTFEVVTGQLSTVLARVTPDHLADVVVAYEPVWAIGTGHTAQPSQAQEVHAMLRGVLAKRDPAAAAATRILYGGSVKPSNADELFAQPDIDGGLIGGASLVPQDFVAICAATGAERK